MIIDKVDDLSMFGRKFGQAVPQDRALVLLRQRNFGIVGIILGALLVIVGGIRVAMRATRAIAVPIVGLVIVVGSILVYAKVY